MIQNIIGRKVGMTQIFSEKGMLIPVTVIEAGPCQVIQRKGIDTDGYTSVQLGYGRKKKNKVNKPLAGHFKKHGSEPSKVIREVRTDGGEDEVKEITVDIFKDGDFVDVSGIVKGRGFSGVFRRYNMAGAPASRGSHEKFRHAGSSAGGSSNITRIWPGKRLPGRMGGNKKTVLNLKVIRVDKETNSLFVKGPVPGCPSGMLMIRKTNRG